MADRSLEQWAAELRRITFYLLPAELRKQAAATALDAQGRAKKRTKNGNPLNSRTGFLDRSIRGYVASTAAPGQAGSGLIEVKLEATAKYAATHERGATIRPTRSRYLAIPMGSAKTAGGDVRRPGPRDYADAFFWRSPKTGQGFIARNVGDRLELLFMLRRQVVIPARPFIRPSLTEAAARLTQRLAGSIKRAAQEAERGR